DGRVQGLCERGPVDRTDVGPELRARDALKGPMTAIAPVPTDNYIDGDWRAPNGGSRFPTYNPANGAVIAEVARADAVDVDAAVSAALGAFPAWRATPAPLRANYLFLIAQIAQEREDELVRVICAEHG